MPIFDFLRLVPGYEYTPEQMAYALKLESMNFRFCVDYGFQNAEAIYRRMMPEVSSAIN